MLIVPGSHDLRIQLLWCMPTHLEKTSILGDHKEM